MRPGPIARSAAALGATAVAAAGLLTAQAFEARRRIGRRTTSAPYADGRYGSGPGTSIRLAILGDSGAAGLGAGHPEDTIGAILATGLAQVSGRTVTLSNHAVIGAQTSDLDGQVDDGERDPNVKSDDVPMTIEFIAEGGGGCAGGAGGGLGALLAGLVAVAVGTRRRRAYSTVGSPLSDLRNSRGVLPVQRRKLR